MSSSFPGMWNKGYGYADRNCSCVVIGYGPKDKLSKLMTDGSVGGKRLVQYMTRIQVARTDSMVR